MLLLTRVDELNTSVRKNPIGKFPDLDQLKLKASTNLNIGSNRVLYNVNYVSEDKRNFAIDQGTYKVIERVTQFAVQRMEVEVENQKSATTTTTTSSSKKRFDWS